MPLLIGTRRTLLTPKPVVVSGGGGGFTPLDISFDFSHTKTFVSHGTSIPITDSASGTTDLYSSGLGYGWKDGTSLLSTSFAMEGRDRLTTLEHQLAGTVWLQSQTGYVQFQVDLPAGTYDTYAVCTDNSAGPHMSISIMDGSTARIATGVIGTSSGNVIDITGAIATAAGFSGWGTPLSAVNTGTNLTMRLIYNGTANANISALRFVRTA